MKDVFDKANEELDLSKFRMWVCYAYGLLKHSMTEKENDELLKRIEVLKSRDW